MGLNKTLRYEEGVLEPNETIAVAGFGSWATTKDLGLNLPVEKILVMETSDDGRLYISDHPSVLH